MYKILIQENGVTIGELPYEVSADTLLRLVLNQPAEKLPEEKPEKPKAEKKEKKPQVKKEVESEKTRGLTNTMLEMMLQEHYVQGAKPEVLAKQHGITIGTFYTMKSKFKKEHPEKVAQWKDVSETKNETLRSKARTWQSVGYERIEIADKMNLSVAEVNNLLDYED